MIRIKQNIFEESISVLPEVKQYNTEQDVDRVDDLFLCALGFEDRCLTIPEKLRSIGYKARQAIYFNYATNIEENRVNLLTLSESLDLISGGNYKPLELSSPDFSKKVRDVLDAATEAGNRLRITFDMSVAANRLMMKFFGILLKSNVDLRVVYTEAKVYHPQQSEWETYKTDKISDEYFGIEKGVGSEKTCNEFPGHQHETLPHALVAFSSFNPDRSRAAMRYVDEALLERPKDRLYWIIGQPRLKENHWRENAVKEINKIGEDETQYRVSTFDYRDTVRLLKRIYEKLWDRYHISISPLGSKMQSIGVSIFCTMHADVRVVLIRPSQYRAEKFSSGSSELWKIEFGSMKEIYDNLMKNGLLEIIPR